jgi:hypothetical protein
MTRSARFRPTTTQRRNHRAHQWPCALAAAGVEFIAENGGGPGVRLKKRKGKRRSPGDMEIR